MLYYVCMYVYIVLHSHANKAHLKFRETADNASFTLLFQKSTPYNLH